MGLLQAGIGAIAGNLADQWKEYFYCESLPADVLVTKGVKRTGGRSSNTKGTDNIISKGSVIAVADGQCMIIVDQGKVAELCAEPGEFVYDSSTSPSIFAGKLGKGILDTFKDIGRRFTFGGEPPKDQRVYYVNTKEILGNKYGTAAPVPFRVVLDERTGNKLTIGIKCFGEYSYHICDPISFYTNVCGNVTSNYTRDNIDSMLKDELRTALQPALAMISEKGIFYDTLPAHTTEIAESLNSVLSEKWRKLRGIEIVSFAVASVTADEKDVERLQRRQEEIDYALDARLGAGSLVSAQAEAMKLAASNTNGSMGAFMGMGMAGMAGGMNAQNLYGVAQQQPQQPQGGGAAPQGGADTWKCSCGATASGKFCPECGKPKPAAGGFWTCSCGTQNKGKFCGNCGAKKPAGVPQYKCDKCGWEPEDPHNPPKFCPRCGDPFNEGDIVK